MAHSTYAEKLLSWFRIYQIQPTEYNARLAAHPKAIRRGIFATALEELVDYEYEHGSIEL